MSTRPTSYGIAKKLRMYFLVNRDEYLTADDVALKLDCTRQQAMRAIETLRYEGIVETLHIVRPLPMVAKC